jgi:uncharacterized protein YprB with RNaseH-like and TPR domain
MPDLIPRHIRRRLAALRGAEAAASPPAPVAREVAPPRLVIPPATVLPEARELETESGVCLSFRLRPETVHPELGPRLAQAAADLGGALPERAHGCLFLDLETLGLSSAPIFLVGLLHVAGGADSAEGFHAHQFLARDYSEEQAILEACVPLLTEAGLLLTYNGRAFDWPYLADRRRVHLLPPLTQPAHLDLLHTARRLYRGVLPSCGLDCVEREVLGLERVGDVPGREIAELYHRAVAQEQLDLLAPVLQHNLLDLLSLACLAGAWRETLNS